MRTRVQYIGMGLLMVLVVMVLACQAGSCAPPPTPTVQVPSATPWVKIVTATPSPAVPPTEGPSPTPAPTQPLPPTPTAPRPPQPTPTLPTPEPHKPVAQIIAPANGAEYSERQVVRVQFTAGDQSGVARVELYVGNTRVSYHEYPQRPTVINNDSLEWTTTAAGNYTLRVIAYDPFNNASAPDQRNIVVKRNATAPTVHIDYPAQRVVIVARQQIQIQATINDEVGIQGLELVERKGGQEIVYTSNPDYHNVPFHWQIWWQSAGVGDHTLFVRAHDANGGVGQSPDFVIGVTDNDPPRVQASYSATSLSPGSNLKVHVEAVDSKGVKEMRLYVDGNVVDTWLAPDPSVGQSHVSCDLWWRNVGPAGSHSAHVWAQDTRDNQAQSPDQSIQVVAAPPTPTPPPPPTPTPPPPTPTPRPSPPRAEIIQPQNGFHSTLPHPVHFVANASGSAPLDKVELWGYAQGQPTHQLYHTWPAGGTTTFTGQYDWIPPNAGGFFFYVRAHDVAGQYGQSGQISGYIEPPSPPTPTPPSAPSVMGNWGAQPEGGNEGFVIIVTDQHASGRLKGTFTIRPAQGQEVTAQLSHDSKIQDHNVTIHAQVGSVTYNFMLALSGDGQSMAGNWSTSQTGLLQPITFNRLLTQ